ncbi:MAG: rod-binding protein [Gammaproteobacteria bacterium]|jgi:flagellar protein FlgJ|nr:rod-binding protein [Gammaproteobacteria bacterium]
MDVKATSNWYDFGSLAGLRAQAGQRPSEAQSSVAEQFESLFINMMLKEMRKTVSRSDLLGSEAMESYEQMFDQQIALGMARAGGIGLAPFIEEQLARQNGQKIEAAAEVAPTSIVLQQRSFKLKER